MYTLDTDSSVSVAAEISDSDFPGVYLAYVALPKTLEAGDFSLDVLLGGLAMVTPAIVIEPCINLEAVERGLLPDSTNVIEIDTVEYIIGDAESIIELPIVTTYCI